MSPPLSFHLFFLVFSSVSFWLWPSMTSRHSNSSCFVCLYTSQIKHTLQTCCKPSLFLLLSLLLSLLLLLFFSFSCPAGKSNARRVLDLALQNHICSIVFLQIVSAHTKHSQSCLLGRAGQASTQSFSKNLLVTLCEVHRNFPFELVGDFFLCSCCFFFWQA